MERVIYEALETFEVELIEEQKMTEIKKGQQFSQNEALNFKSKIDKLMKKGRIKEVGAVEVLKKTISSEQVQNESSQHSSLSNEKKHDEISQKLNDESTSLILHQLEECFKSIEGVFKKELYTVKQNLWDNIDATSNKNNSQITDASSQNVERLSQLKQIVETSYTYVEDKFNELPNRIAEINEQIEHTVKSATRSLRTSVEETKEAMESLQGKSHVLNDLKGKLDKVNITAKLSPFDHDDDVVLELAEQGKNILDQLTLASRHYALQKKEIQRLEEENRRLKQERERTAETTEKAVELITRNKVTREMIINIASAFSNLDDVYDDEKLAGLQALLHNHGLSRSDRYKKDEIIDITNDNRTTMEKGIDFEFSGEGHYRLTSSQFVWREKEELFKKAKAKKFNDLRVSEEEYRSERME